MSFWCPLTGHLLHKLCVRLILNVHTSRSCRKYVFVATCVGLWIALLRMAHRNSRVSLFYPLVGSSSRVSVTKNHRNGWYFYVFPGQLAAEHDSNGFTRHCPKLPPSAAQTAHETIWESILRFSAEAMTAHKFHVLRCVSTLPEHIHWYLYSCSTLSLLYPCHHFFFFYCQIPTVRFSRGYIAPLYK